MKYKPIDKINILDDVIKEISLVELKLKELPKRVIREVLTLTGVAIVFPFLYGKYGRRPMIEHWDYENALIFIVAVFIITYVIAHTWRKKKLDKRYRELKLKKHLLEREKFNQRIE